MKRIAFLGSLLFLFPLSLWAQFIINEEEVVLETPVGKVHGTLQVPATGKPMPVVVIIGGSGPTDRNGNQPQMQCNNLKMLADGLYNQQIATLAFDKRLIGASRNVTQKEEDLRFDDYITDVKSWVNQLAADKRFSEIIIAGHSEGALIGMIAAQNNSKVSKYISFAGVGQPLSDILREQLTKQLVGQPESVKNQIFQYIEMLERGETFENVPIHLQALFRPSVQPYLISSFKYNPQKEIASLKQPVLIVQGTTDIQVSVEQAELLAKGNPKAKKVLLPNINHVLKECESTDMQKQMATYTNPLLPISHELVKIVGEFIKGN